MSDDKGDKSTLDKQARKSKDRAAEVANTFEWLITAFILAFVFRAFVMEAFRIPTGSMADTLRGAHFRLRCRQCGYEYEHGFVPSLYYGGNGRPLPEDTVPAGKASLAVTRCPNCGCYPSKLRCLSCGFYQIVPNNTGRDGGAEVPSSRCKRCNRTIFTVEQMPVANGDRILVLKCIYQFFEPKRWDVIVFKNPPEPTINYIKRLIGLPGEKVQIIDGDIYIDDKIARKPAKIQNELWMPVYDNDYQPVQPREGLFNGHIWAQPFRNVADSKWDTTNPGSPTVFSLDSQGLNTIAYDTSIGNNFRATYAYDDVDQYNILPICSDLMVRFDCRAADSQGRIGIALSKYDTNYKAWLDLTGEMVICRQEKGSQSEELARKSIEPNTIDESGLMKFANVDHQLIFEFGNEKLTCDLGSGLEDVGPIRKDVEPRVEIFGSGKLTLSHIAILRDIHYTEPFGSQRANEDKPLSLREDQFFVLGDNSPNSEDGRLWRSLGRANKGLPDYDAGIVPRDYLVGKALFVYWPSGFKPFVNFPFGIVPNVGKMRFIYGGSNGNN